MVIGIVIRNVSIVMRQVNSKQKLKNFRPKSGRRLSTNGGGKIPEQITINLVGGVNNRKINVQDAEIVK